MDGTDDPERLNRIGVVVSAAQQAHQFVVARCEENRTFIPIDVVADDDSGFRLPVWARVMVSGRVSHPSENAGYTAAVDRGTCGACPYWLIGTAGEEDGDGIPFDRRCHDPLARRPR